MELEIKWTSFAKNELKNIYNYYKENISKSSAIKIADGITNDVTILENHPNIGPIEELLKGSENDFRYLLSKRNYKIIYWINLNNKTIEIVDIFDVRQNPIKMNTER
jgi:addiction module RelE/StbE family toxin